MSRPRKKTVGRRGYGSNHIALLRHGPLMYQVPEWQHQYGSKHARLRVPVDDLRPAWRALHTAVFNLHQEERNAAYTRPWGWWVFESPLKCRPSRIEGVELYHLGEISKAALQPLLVHERRLEVDRKPFRRSPLWWIFEASEPRDLSRFESSQLSAMGELSAGEKEIIEGDVDAGQLCNSEEQRFRCHHITDDAERELLGLALQNH